MSNQEASSQKEEVTYSLPLIDGEQDVEGETMKLAAALESEESRNPIPEFLRDPAKQRPDEFKNHGIVAEFAQRGGWVGHTIDWTNLFLTEELAHGLEQLIEAQSRLVDEEGLSATPKEIFDAANMLASCGKTVLSHTELGEVIREQRQTNKNSDSGRERGRTL